MPTRPLRAALLLAALAAPLAAAQPLDPALPADVPVAIPSLEAVVGQMMRHSPRVEYREALVRRTRAEVSRTRASWTDNVILGSTALYDTRGVLYAPGSEVYTPTPTQGFNEGRLGVTVGLTFRVSLYELMGRRHETQSAREDVAVARQQERVARLEVEALATNLYHDLLLRRRLVAVKANALAAATSHLEMAEREFNRSAIALAEFARVTSIQADAEAEYEIARSEYLNAYAQLETAVGMPLAELAGRQDELADRYDHLPGSSGASGGGVPEAGAATDPPDRR